MFFALAWRWGGREYCEKAGKAASPHLSGMSPADPRIRHALRNFMPSPARFYVYRAMRREAERSRRKALILMALR